MDGHLYKNNPYSVIHHMPQCFDKYDVDLEKLASLELEILYLDDFKDAISSYYKIFIDSGYKISMQSMSMYDLINSEKGISIRIDVNLRYKEDIHNELCHRCTVKIRNLNNKYKMEFKEIIKDKVSIYALYDRVSKLNGATKEDCDDYKIRPIHWLYKCEGEQLICLFEDIKIYIAEIDNNKILINNLATDPYILFKFKRLGSKTHIAVVMSIDFTKYAIVNKAPGKSVKYENRMYRNQPMCKSDKDKLKRAFKNQYL
jgi:hypothetical protein